MEFRSLHTLTTADNVPIRVELAGLVSRVFAFVLDMIAMLTLMGGLLLVLFLPPSFRQFPEVQKTLMPLGIFIIFFGYHLFQEWLWNGQTIGKRILGIRVVRQDGQAIGFWESLGRNLLRVVDVYISGVGLICMLFNAQEKRFGDFLAGTLVIQNQVIGMPVYRPVIDAGILPEDTDLTVSRRLTGEEAAWIQTFLSRRHRLLMADRLALEAEVCTYFTQRLQEPIQTELDLETLFSQYQAQFSS